MKIFGKILAVLYTIIFTIVLFILSIGIFTSNLFKGSFYSEVLKNVDLNELPASTFGLGEEGETLKDTLVNALQEAGFEKKLASEILEDEEIKDVIGNLIGDIANYSVNKDKVPQINKSDVEKILNNDSVKKLIPADFDTKDIDEFVNQANDMLKDGFSNWEGLLNG